MRNDNMINHLFTEDKPSNHRADLEKFMFHWKYFLLSIVLTLALVIIKLRYTPNQYEVSTMILIDADENGAISSELSAFQDLGILGEQKTSLETEITVLQSKTLIQRAIKNLGYNISFYDKGKIYNRELYLKQAHFKVNFLNKNSKFYEMDSSFIIKAKSKTKYELINSDGIIVKVSAFGDVINSDFGDMIITPSEINTIVIGEEIKVTISPLKAVSSSYRSKIQIKAASKKSNGLIISLTDPIRLKAIDILNELVEQYNLDAIEDKSVIARSTSEFINRRIEGISRELESIDKGVEDYKTDNKLTDIGYEAGLILDSNSEVEKTIVDLNSQIKLIDYVLDYMEINKNDLIPENLGLSDEVTSQNTGTYNQLLLERNRILKGSSRLNPTVINLENQIETLRESIFRSLENSRKSLYFTRDEARIQAARLSSKRSLAPKQEREFLDIKRKQQIIESLYLYLLQKREENAITVAVPEPNAKIIDFADGDKKPVSPKKYIFLLGGLFLGMVIPIVVILINGLFDNKVHSAEDVESEVDLPLLGEIPNSKIKEKVIISEKISSEIAESFRLLRTNLNFMLSEARDQPQAIFITSTIAGEGKSIIAINLAISLHLINKKVLIIGADIRKPKLNNYLKISYDKGLTEYLSDSSLEVSDLIKSTDYINLDILQSGAIPPNPSELLTNGQFEKLLDFSKANYDYVIVDTAPVHSVTDTLQLAHFADVFIYVIRANYLDKRLLKIPRLMNENKRLPNMGILINAVNFRKKSYGYGYGYSEKEKKTRWWNK